MRLFVLAAFCVLSIRYNNCTVMLNCALGLTEEKYCPVDGSWSLWTTWSNCEGECSRVGRQVRYRNCSNPRPSNNGRDCVGSQHEAKQCGMPGCSFEEYERLLQQDKNRLQQLKTLQQVSVSQSALLTKCLLIHCDFETISQALGSKATAFWNSLLCVKENVGCPVAGGWGGWSEWSRCSALCGQGQQFRCRACCDPPPNSPNMGCHGEVCENQPCLGTQCGQPQKQEGAWSDWSQWSSCNAKCNFGITRRSRICNLGNQKKAKKSLQQGNFTKSVGYFDNLDYYDDYFYDSYGQDYKKDYYRDLVDIDNLSKQRKRHAGKCDTKIEYYSTEDYEENSKIFTKSSFDKSTDQLFAVTSRPTSEQNTQKLPETTQLYSKLKSTKEQDNLESLFNSKFDKGEKKCDSKIDYYSTEDYEDYSTIFKKSSESKIIDQLFSVSSTSTQNIQKLPETTQFYPNLKSTTEQENLKSISSSNVGKGGGKCYSKVEYYSTEEYEDYSSIFTKSLVRRSTTPVKNIHTHPDTPHSNPKLKTTTGQESLGSISNSKVGKGGGKCDSKIEYYSTEDYEDYSTVFSKSLVSENSDQLLSVSSTSLQNIQQLPKTTQLYPKIKPTKEQENLEPLSNSKVDKGGVLRVSLKTTKEIIPVTVNLKPTKSILCSVPKFSKSTKQPRVSEEEHRKGRKKSKTPLRYLSSTGTNEHSTETHLKTGLHLTICHFENSPLEKNYKREPEDSEKITVSDESECTDELYGKSEETTASVESAFTDELNGKKEEDISIFGNIEVHNKNVQSKLEPNEKQNITIDSEFHEGKTTKTISSFATSKTTCVTLKPEDDIVNLGKYVHTTLEPLNSLQQTIHYSIPILETTNTLKKLLLTPSNNELKENQTNSTTEKTSFDGTSFNESSTNGFNLATVQINQNNELDNLNFENTSETNLVQSCDITNLLQLPNYNESQVIDGCKGPFEEIKTCNIKPCNEEGGWSSWSAWSPCSKGCGLGRQVSTRSCTHPEPSKSGYSCLGETRRKRSCYDHLCPTKAPNPVAMLMSSESYIKYTAIGRHSSVLILYLRFKHYNCSGGLITRRSSQCKDDSECNLVKVTLYNCYIFLIVRVQKCIAYLLSRTQVSIGDWHEVLVAIVGTYVTMRIDDNFLTQSENLSCRPFAPDFDSDMKLGGHFIGEIDRIRVNFKAYNLQKKQNKRDAWFEREESIEPETSSQVQFSLNKEEVITKSLALFLNAPCFTNETFWTVEVVIRPEFSEGVVFFFRGYNQGEFVLVTLEHNRVLLQVKISSASGECEQPLDIAPQTWLQITVSKMPSGPLGLAVNGGERCVVNLSEANDTEEPSIHCTTGIFLGEISSTVKNLITNNAELSGSLSSSLGLLGSLTIDNHTIDLSRLPHKTASDLSSNFSSKHYKFSSDMASITVHYEEMFIFEREPFSLTCLYDLSPEQTQTVPQRDLDLSEYTASWIKLDLPIETAFEQSGRNITYIITDSGKLTRLNMTRHSDSSVEGFYSCWLHYPFPLQPGLMLITYSVIVISINENELWRFKYLTYTLILLIICLAWIIREAFINFRKGTGFYYCKSFSNDEANTSLRTILFSKAGIKLLGNKEAANESYQRNLTRMEADRLKVEFGEANNNKDLDVLTNETSDEANETDEIQSEHGKENPSKGMKQPRNVVVGFTTENHLNNPLFLKEETKPLATGLSRISTIKGKLFNTKNVSLDDFQKYKDDDKETESLEETTCLRNYSIYNSRELENKEFGQIQETPAYKSIKNDLKLVPNKP